MTENIKKAAREQESKSQTKDKIQQRTERTKKVECVIFGGLLLDKYFHIRELPKRGQDGFIDGDLDLVGGCAINMAATFNNLGGEAHVVSYIGQDQTGSLILDYLKEHGLSLRYVAQKQGVTGYCMVFLEPDGERTFLTRTGMELGFSRGLVSDHLKGITHAAVTGYFLLNDGAEELMGVLEEFHRGGGYILFDPSPLVGDISESILSRMLEISDVVTPNTSEIGALAQCGQKTESPLNINSEKIAASVQAAASGETVETVETGELVQNSEYVQKWIRQFVAEGKYVVLKQGALGGTLYRKDGMSGYAAVNAEVVDTTGAGDSFAAGILFGLASGLPMERAVGLGGHTSAQTVSINGPHGFWEPNEIMEIILNKKY